MEKPVHCTVKDFPDWARSAVAEHLGSRSRPHCTIVAVEGVVDIGTPWRDGIVRKIVACRGDGEVKKVPATSHDCFLNASREEQAAYLGEPMPLPPDCMLLVTETDGRFSTATLYARHENVALLLPKPEPLSDLELKALCIISGLIPSWRKELFVVYGIGEDVFAALRRRGLITKSRAITVNGRNVMEDVPYETAREACSPPFELRSKYYEKQRLAKS